MRKVIDCTQISGINSFCQTAEGSGVFIDRDEP